MTYWFTFNEIWADASNTYIEGTFPGGVKAHLAEAFQCEHNMMLAHAKAVLAFHNGGFKGKIGVIQSLEFKYPLNENDPADIKAANNEHVLQNQFLLDATFRGDYAPDTYTRDTTWRRPSGRPRAASRVCSRGHAGAPWCRRR